MGSLKRRKKWSTSSGRTVLSRVVQFTLVYSLMTLVRLLLMNLVENNRTISFQEKSFLLVHQILFQWIAINVKNRRCNSITMEMITKMMTTSASSVNKYTNRLESANRISHTEITTMRAHTSKVF